MPLIKVKILDYAADYVYAPPQKEGWINTDEIAFAKPTESRGEGPFLYVRFRDGSSVTIVATDLTGGGTS